VFARLFASVLFCVCLPMVSWAGSISSAAESATSGTVSGVLLIAVSPNNFAFELNCGYEWERPRADGGVADSPPANGLDTSSAATDIGVESGRGFLLAEERATDIARPGRATGASSGVRGWGRETMDPGVPSGRWLRIGHAAAPDLIDWNTLGLVPGREGLALCLIGLLRIVPSMLRRRGPSGGRRSVRRRRVHAGYPII
jgi:hypothetical protein